MVEKLQIQTRHDLCYSNRCYRDNACFECEEQKFVSLETLQPLIDVVKKLRMAEEILSKYDASHVASVLASHCETCHKVLDLWNENIANLEKLRELLACLEEKPHG